MLTEEEYLKIEEYSALFLTIAEIAIMTGINEDFLRAELDNKNSELFPRFHRARLNEIIKIRKQEIEMASLGSNTAIEQVEKYILEQQLDIE